MFIFIPGKPGITVTPVDRETGPGAGAGTSGNRSLMLGLNAGQNSTGSDLYVIGSNALSGGLNLGATQGSGSIFIGTNAGQSLTSSAGPNFFIGLNAGATLTGPAADRNILMGDHIFAAIPSNNVNNTVAIGHGIMSTYALNVAQQDNVFVGTDIANFGGGGGGGSPQLSNNVVIGWQAIHQFDTSAAFTWSGNVIIGSTCCAGPTQNVSGSVYIGNSAGLTHTGQPFDNVVIGASAGGTVANPTHCVAVGFGTSTGLDHNTIIGDFINGNPDTATRCILIGAGAATSSFPAASFDLFLVETVVGGVERAILFGNMAAGNLVVGNATFLAGHGFGTGATNALKIVNGTLPSTAPDVGGEFFALGGEVIWVNTNATVTPSALTGLQSDGTYSYQVPVNGFAITLGSVNSLTILDPAGVLATGTITMPPNPLRDGTFVQVASSKTVTALTVSANAGQSINGAPITIAANTSFSYRFKLSNTTWYRIT
jgi:hypothetical protein